MSSPHPASLCQPPTGPLTALRFRPFTRLPAVEQERLKAMLVRKQQFNPQDEILIEGEISKQVYLIEEGWAYRYKLLSDGRRQILNLALPGDFVGLRSGLFGIGDQTVVALTPVRAARIGTAEVVDLFRDHPKLAAAVAWSSARDESILADRIVSLGRRNALERVSHFFLELLVRLQALGLAGENSFLLPLTQELMGDLLGLSVVHVNRTLRRLREEGLITLENGRAVLHRLDELVALSDFDPAYLDSSFNQSFASFSATAEADPVAAPKASRSAIALRDPATLTS